MPPKTERFEMRMDEEELQRLDAWRGDQSDLPSRAEAMRRLMEIGLANAGGRRAIVISDGEKLILSLMADLMKKAGVKDSDVDPRFVMQAICGGHNWALDWEYQGLFPSQEDRPNQVSFVVDVLDMWSFIESANRKLNAEQKAQLAETAGFLGKHVGFRGFDGNNESEYMGIARFLVEEMNRFSEFKGRDFNSHYPYVATYGKMLAVFLPIRKTLIGQGLSLEQLTQILKAAG